MTSPADQERAEARFQCAYNAYMRFIEKNHIQQFHDAIRRIIAALDTFDRENPVILTDAERYTLKSRINDCYLTYGSSNEARYLDRLDALVAYCHSILTSTPSTRPADMSKKGENVDSSATRQEVQDYIDREKEPKLAHGLYWSVAEVYRVKAGPLWLVIPYLSPEQMESLCEHMRWTQRQRREKEGVEHAPEFVAAMGNLIKIKCSRLEPEDKVHIANAIAAALSVAPNGVGHG